MTVTDRYFHVIPEVLYTESQFYKYKDSYAEPLPKKYLQQKFLQKILVPNTTADFTLRVSKSYVPYGNALCADTSQGLQVKK